jgi:prepilin-type N-terminal cleavage/methylation domain-containing protein
MMRRGFTLFEVLLASALVTIIAAFGWPMWSGLRDGADLYQSVQIFVHEARRAKILARTGAADGPWGVKVTPGSIVLFRGASYDAREEELDELASIPPGVTTTEGEIVFDGFSGIPQGILTWTFQSPNGAERTVSINVEGAFDY